MNRVQPLSRKIKKTHKHHFNDCQSFVCGECGLSYKFYPGLYLHIKRKHQGIRPPGTKAQRPKRPISDFEVKAGRPKKGEEELDQLGEAEMKLEGAQNELLKFLGEKELTMKHLEHKPSLENIIIKIEEAFKSSEDQWVKEFIEESRIFLSKNQKRDIKARNLDFDEEFVHLDPEKSLNVIVWFVMWLLNVYVKPEFIMDLCLVFSRVWKVLNETKLDVKDLDNKLVWKRIVKDCEGLIENLSMFVYDLSVLNKFVEKACQLIGKAFEEDNLEY